MHARPVSFGLSSAVLLSAMSIALGAQAANYTHSGKIRNFRTHNDSAINDFITLEGLTGTGTGCATFNGYISLKLPARGSDEYKPMHAMLLAAKLSGQPITVEYSNTWLTQGSCTLRWVANDW